MPAEIELFRYQDLLWAVDLNVGGRDATFLIDTGAGVTIVDRALAEDLGLEEYGRATGHRMTGERVDIALTQNIGMVLAGHRLGSRPLASST